MLILGLACGLKFSLCPIFAAVESKERGANASWLALMAADSTMCCPQADKQQAVGSSRAGGPTDKP